MDFADRSPVACRPVRALGLLVLGCARRRSPRLKARTGAGAAADVPGSIVDLTNVERARAGVAPLRANAQLMRAAQLHAEQMASLGRVAHVLDGAPVPVGAGSARGRRLPLERLRGERRLGPAHAAERYRRLDGVGRASRQHAERRLHRARHRLRRGRKRTAVLRAGVRQAALVPVWPRVFRPASGALEHAAEAARAARAADEPDAGHERVRRARHHRHLAARLERHDEVERLEAAARDEQRVGALRAPSNVSAQNSVSRLSMMSPPAGICS